MSFNMRNPRVCSRLNICDSFPGRPFRWLMYLWCVWLFSTSGQSPGNLLGGSYASWEGAVLLHLLMTCFLLGNKRFSAVIAVDLLWVHVRDDLRMLVLCSHSKRGCSCQCHISLSSASSLFCLKVLVPWCPCEPRPNAFDTGTPRLLITFLVSLMTCGLNMDTDRERQFWTLDKSVELNTKIIQFSFWLHQRGYELVLII